MLPLMEYTRRDLAHAVLDAHPDSTRGLNMFYGRFSDDMKKHQAEIRDGLLKAFGVDLDSNTAVKLILKGTVDSNAAIRGPMSNFGEAGLLIRKLESSGVLDKVDEIHRLNVQSLELHLDIAEELLGLVDATVE